MHEQTVTHDYVKYVWESSGVGSHDASSGFYRRQEVTKTTLDV